MNNKLLILKVKQRLNKLDSSDYDNIKPWQIVEAFNKSQLEFVRRLIKGGNSYRDGDEGSKNNIDDIQFLLTSKRLNTSRQDKYYDCGPLPSDYLYYKRVSLNAKTDCCGYSPLTVYLTEESDVDNLLSDELKKPSYIWGETFATIKTNILKIYTNGEFEIDSPNLTYYRRPIDIQILNTINPATQLNSTVEVSSEFKDDVMEVLIDATCVILSGDMELFNQSNRLIQNQKINE